MIKYTCSQNLFVWFIIFIIHEQDPGAGMVMLIIVLSQAGIPEIGLALIFAVDRPLDMCRTVINVTGDATVSMFVNKFRKK